MVHQRDQRMTRAKLRGRLGKNAEGQPIDNDDASFWDGRKPRQCSHAARVVRPWEAFTEIDEIDMPAEMFEFRDHAPVIGIAASRRRKIAWNREREALHHKAASYHARAI